MSLEKIINLYLNFIKKPHKVEYFQLPSAEENSSEGAGEQAGTAD